MGLRACATVEVSSTRFRGVAQFRASETPCSRAAGLQVSGGREAASDDDEYTVTSFSQLRGTYYCAVGPCSLFNYYLFLCWRVAGFITTFYSGCDEPDAISGPQLVYYSWPYIFIYK